MVTPTPVVTFHEDGTATVVVQVMNTGSKVPVVFGLVMLPDGKTRYATGATVSACTTGLRNVRLAGSGARPLTGLRAAALTGLSTVSVTFGRAKFPTYPTSLTGVTVEILPVIALGAGHTDRHHTKHTHRARREVEDAPASARSGTNPFVAILCGARKGGTSAVEQEVVPASIRRLTGVERDLVAPALAGAVAAAIFWLLVWVNTPKVEHTLRLKSRWVQAGSSWNFKDNWATNIGAAGAVVGTALIALGSSSTLLPGVQLGNFALLLSLWGVLSVLAPLLLLARQEPRQEGMVDVKYWVLMIAGGLTLVSIIAQLGTAIVLIDLSVASAAVRFVVSAVVGLAGVVVLGYAVRNTLLLITDKSAVEKSLAT